MGLKIRHDTAANWTTANPTLELAEQGYETDTGKMKIGDGVTAWTSLAYQPSGAGALLAANNLSDVANAATARTNLVVPSTARQIAAGSGLTGGGDLTADRTLAADFGTGAGKVTQGNDSRLSDARTPTAHAASHASAGSDPITIAESQVTNLTTDLAAKAPLLFVAQLTATQTISNTTTETTVWTPTNFAAASLSAHTTLFRFRLGGTFDNIATSGTFTSRLKANGTTIATVQIANNQTALATGTIYFLDLDVYVDATGLGGAVTVVGNGDVTTAAGGTINPRPVNQTTSVSLVAGLQFTFTGQMATANAGNVLRATRGVIQQVA